MTHGADFPGPPEGIEDDGWELVERETETVFRMPTSRVVGHTLLYDDADLRSRLEPVAPDYEGPWRFFFATRLEFIPPLAPGIGTASVLPTVSSEATRKFRDDLRERGFTNVEKGRSQRVRTDTRDRARIWKYTATYDGAGPDLDVEGWLGVWTRGSSFRIAGGAYPVRGLSDLVAQLPEDDRPDVTPSRFRDELLDLIRSVA